MLYFISMERLAASNKDKTSAGGTASHKLCRFRSTLTPIPNTGALLAIFICRKLSGIMSIGFETQLRYGGCCMFCFVCGLFGMEINLCES